MGCLAHTPAPASASGASDERLIFSCEHAGIGVGHLSLTGCWLRFNHMLCQITGYAREQLLGKGLAELTCPEDRDSDDADLRRLLNGELTSYSTEKRFLQPHGARVWVHLTVSLARTPAGAPDYLLLVVEDISARKETETLRATLAAIVRHSADAIVSEDLEGAITSWNAGAERIFGYTAQEVMGRPVFMLAPPEKANEVRRILERVRSGKPVHRMEAIRIRKDGQRICVALSVSPLRDPAGKLIGIAKIARDITELKAAEQALQEARRQLAEANAFLEQQVQQRTSKLRETVVELEHMSYSIMHDMRAPLRAITAYSELIEADPATRLGPDSREFLARAKTAAHRMDELIRDVLNYSHLVQQGLEIHPVNVAELLRGIIETYPAFQPPKVRIRLAPDLPRVFGNEAALTQCFSNLLDNAVKFVRPGERPQIEIKSEAHDGRARILVEDNGIGVPRDLQERIFGIFQRGSNAYEGTGIGLAIVRKAAERMGGKAGVDSEPGQGSRFWLELPLAITQ
jgi:PAS domain S-box-containing protein